MQTPLLNVIQSNIGFYASLHAICMSAFREALIQHKTFDAKVT